VRKVGTAQVELDSVKIISEDEKELVLPGVLAHEGILPYAQGRAYRSADELQRSLFTFEGAWVVGGKHPETWVLMDPELIGGRVDHVEWDAESKSVRGQVHLLKAKVSADFLAAVKAGVLSKNSIGFMYEEDWTSGLFDGQKYDFVQRKILVDHVAVGVPLPRDPGCTLGVDSAEFCSVAEISIKSEVPRHNNPASAQSEEKVLLPESVLEQSRRVLQSYGNMPKGRSNVAEWRRDDGARHHDGAL
jgi:hypothetical protein